MSNEPPKAYQGLAKLGKPNLAMEVGKWRKCEMRAALRILSAPTTNPHSVAEAMWEGYKEEIRLRIHQFSQSKQVVKVGRPESITIKEAKDLIRRVNNQRMIIAKEKKVPLSKVSMPMVARRIARIILEHNPARAENKTDLAKYIMERIKYLNKKIRSGE